MKSAGVILSSGLIVVLAFWIGLQISDRIVGEPKTAPAAVSQGSDETGGSPAYKPPSMDEVPEGPLGEAITYGHKLVNETNTVADGYVGNQLSCTSCHAGAGLEENVSSLVGVTAKYPQYMPREGEIRTIEDRINGCMIRSMNGKEFPLDSKEMKAMVSYLSYISQGIKVGDELPWLGTNNMKNVPVPDIAAGEQTYQKSCIACHAADGNGTGTNTGPALWGPDSFNDGAGLSRLSKMAGYIQSNMPVGQEGTLSDQDAANLAAFILSQDRPEWKGKDGDWPHGGKPNDIINKEKREQVKNGTINWEEVVKTK